MIPHLDLLDSEPKRHSTMRMNRRKIGREDGVKDTQNAQPSLIVCCRIAERKDLDLHFTPHWNRYTARNFNYSKYRVYDAVLAHTKLMDGTRASRTPYQARALAITVSSSAPDGSESRNPPSS